MARYYPCFKAYDIRGRVPDELNPELVYRIGRAYAQWLRPKTIVVGRDARLSSDALVEALINGLNDAGVDVVDIGLCGTEEVYYATFSQHCDGGIMLTASHNPPDYNGLKLVRQDARPISSDDGLLEIEALTAANQFPAVGKRGGVRALALREEYADFLLGFVDVECLAPLKVVVNAGNGCAGLVVDALAPKLPFELIRLQHEPDGHFPNGVPNPLLPECRAITAEAVRAHGADLGVAWDGDFDRCFLFDEQGEFVEGYYIVGLIAQALLKREPGGRVVHDPRLVWNTLDVVGAAQGEAVQTKAGHAFIKARMREEDAIYGGEMSAHHYFRDFAYCDNGNIPWLLVAQLMSVKGASLSSMLQERIRKFPASGEINREVGDADRALQSISAHYRPQALAEEQVDGVSMDCGEWRFNLRKSNTEPLVRLNVESRADQLLMQSKTAEILALLDQF
jgi:phosphomannomutase/phosphomannomutase/phosphoglucomutase